LKEASNNNQNNIPLLVKINYKMQQINNILWVNKDLVEINNLCSELKQFIIQEK
jgi:hypothetical protein